MGRNMTHWRIPALSVLMLGLFVPGWQESTQAGTALATPPGLQPGDTFRFVFVTDATIDGTSNNIDTYDTLVNTEANTTVAATYGGAALTWQAIGSTNTVSAINHIGSSISDQVFLVDGTKVAASTTTSAGGLWSGALLSPIDENLLGQVHSPDSPAVWTGTSSTGLGSGFFVLGSTTFIPGISRVGNATSNTATWIDDGNSF